MLRECASGDRCRNSNGSLLPESEFVYSTGRKLSKLRRFCKACRGYYDKSLIRSRENKIEVESKLCSKKENCLHPNGPLLPASEFNKKDSNKDGLYYFCKICQHEEQKRWRDANPEKVHQSQVDWRDNNPEKARALMKIKHDKRDAVKRDLPYDITEDQFRYISNFFELKCAYCGRGSNEEYSIVFDHIVPLTPNYAFEDRNPGTTVTNLVLACHSKSRGAKGCNNKKSNKELITWLLYEFGEDASKDIIDRITDFQKQARDEFRK